MNTGRSGMVAAKASIATTGHNISNASTEGYSRQRVHQKADMPRSVGGKGFVGTGTLIERVERVNDKYVDKQLRNAGRDLSNLEEKDLVLRQTEDIFNEMGGEGLNRLMARFFNEFRKLANEPSNEAVRQSVREASQSVVNDIKRLRRSVEDVQKHIDSRLEGHTRQINSYAEEVKDLNIRIRAQTINGGSPNDLLDQRDRALKNLAELIDVQMHTDKDGNYTVDVKGVGPLVAGPNAEKFSVARTPADRDGKSEGAVDIISSASANGKITHAVKGGRVGALLEVRDRTLSSILDRLDQLAFDLSRSVNQIHEQGFTTHGLTGVKFFKPLDRVERAAEFLSLSNEVENDAGMIAAAAGPNLPGDNRVAIALSGLQGMRLMGDGRATFDDFYNSIVSDVGVATERNRSSINQQKDIQNQLVKIRDQISGVSIDEETANLLQFQHSFDASAKVIQVADELLKTVLDLRR